MDTGSETKRYHCHQIPTVRCRSTAEIAPRTGPVTQLGQKRPRTTRAMVGFDDDPPLPDCH